MKPLHIRIINVLIKIHLIFLFKKNHRFRRVEHFVIFLFIITFFGVFSVFSISISSPLKGLPNGPTPSTVTTRWGLEFLIPIMFIEGALILRGLMMTMV